jgi:hypothetical protein
MSGIIINPYRYAAAGAVMNLFNFGWALEGTLIGEGI